MNSRIFKIIMFSGLIIIMACSSSKMGLKNPINASVIGTEYSSNIEQGDKRYKGKYLTIVGEISESYQNKFQESILILMDKDKKHGVKCTLIKSGKPQDRPFKLGETIKVNGKCTGFDEYVLMNGCIILRN